MEYKELELYKDKFIVFECENDRIEMYQVRTFYYQVINGVRDFRYSMTQDKSYLYYENNKEFSLVECLNKGLDKDDIHRMLVQIKLILENCHNYLLYPENFCFHPSFIKLDTSLEELKVELLYVPFREGMNDKYKEYVELFISTLAKSFNELNDMEGFYYFVRLNEQFKSDEEPLDICEYITMYLNLYESRNPKENMLI